MKKFMAMILSIGAVSLSACGGSSALSEEEINAYIADGYTMKEGYLLEKVDYELAYTLEAMSLSTELDGKIYLTHGEIKEEPVYLFYYRTADGGFKLESITADGDYSTIYYIEEDEQPHIDVSVSWSQVGIYDGNTDHGGYISGKKYKIYVPAGSIANTYNLDLDNK